MRKLTNIEQCEFALKLVEALEYVLKLAKEKGLDK